MLCKCTMSPTFNGGSEIKHFECSDTIEIQDGIIFDFYTGLPPTCFHRHQELITARLISPCVAGMLVMWLGAEVGVWRAHDRTAGTL